MVREILHFFENIGLFGLMATMFIEGSSLPFPGVLAVLAYGYILSGDIWYHAYIAVWMSVMYSLSSLIPYFIGKKLGNFFKGKSIRRRIRRSKVFFVRYGQWSVAVSRPFGLGNYISYVAGLSHMNIGRYLILTFIGIYPWSLVMILLGHYFKGNYDAFQAFYQQHSTSVYLGVCILIGGIIFYYWFRHKRAGQRRAKKVRARG